MNKKHPNVPWYGAPTAEESVQTQAMLDALSTDPSAHIGSLKEGISSKDTKACTTCSKQIQALIKEIPTNIQFPQTPQPKPRKRYGGASTSAGSVASMSKIHTQHIIELAWSSEVPLPTSPPPPPSEEELSEALPYKAADPEDDSRASEFSSPPARLLALPDLRIKQWLVL